MLGVFLEFICKLLLNPKRDEFLNEEHTFWSSGEKC